VLQKMGRDIKGLTRTPTVARSFEIGSEALLVTLAQKSARRQALNHSPELYQGLNLHPVIRLHLHEILFRF
jgi:hypothetical protein